METVLKAFANLLKPFLDPEAHPVEFYSEPGNLGLSFAEQLDKHNEGLKVFERTLLETGWTVEKIMLEIENLKSIEAGMIRGLNVTEGVDAEGFISANGSRDDVKEIILLRDKLRNRNAMLAEEMDKYFQQEAFCKTIRKRMEIAIAKKDVTGFSLVDFRFKTSGEINGTETVA